MLFPIFLLLLLGAVYLLGRYLWTRRASLWRTAIITGLVLGIVRASAVLSGWWAVERTSGWLQIPGYFLAILAWPEVLLLPRQTKSLETEGYAMLGGLIFAGTLSGVLFIALVVELLRRRSRPVT